MQYLIRKNDKYILGPFNKDDFIRLFREGEITPNCELCSHLNEWIFLHSKIDLRTIYPNIYDIVYPESHGSWDDGETVRSEVATKLNDTIDDEINANSKRLLKSASTIIIFSLVIYAIYSVLN